MENNMERSSGKDFLLTRNNFAVVLTGGEDRISVNRAFSDVGWCEFRVDEFLRDFPEEEITGWLSVNRKSVDFIGTVRSDRERQDRGLHIPEGKRLEIYKKIIERVDYIDVEIKSRIAEEVSNLARKKRRKVILSYHNFLRTPCCKTLENIYREGMMLRPDIIKVAANVRSGTDLLTLISFTSRYAKKFPLVVIPMGVPACCRLIPLYFGSLFTYISLGKKTAPGQISHEELRSMKWLL